LRRQIWRDQAITKPHVRFHPNGFPRPASPADEEFLFTETLAAPGSGATAVHTDHAQSGVVVGKTVRYLKQSGTFRAQIPFQVAIHARSAVFFVA
jgi:hypothetical protein